MRRSRRIRVLGFGGPLAGVAKDRVRWVSGVKCLRGCRRENLPYKHFLVRKEYERRDWQWFKIDSRVHVTHYSHGDSIIEQKTATQQRQMYIQVRGTCIYKKHSYVQVVSSLHGQWL